MRIHVGVLPHLCMCSLLLLTHLKMQDKVLQYRTAGRTIPQDAHILYDTYNNYGNSQHLKHIMYIQYNNAFILVRVEGGEKNVCIYMWC